MTRCLLLGLLLLTGLLARGAEAQERRVALVIGNGRYAAVPELANPTRDALTVADAFRKAGFQSVQVEQNLGRAAMVSALRRFEETAVGADWSVIYFAGHGMELNGTNYLLPVDAELRVDKDVQDEAVPLDRALSTLEGTKKLRLVILDACRDNPFGARMKRSVSTRSLVTRGLSAIEPESGVLVMYAAKHGQVALDGDAPNSPFATAFVKRLGEPGLEINKLFRAVRDDVMKSTARRQEPWLYGTLPFEDFFFSAARPIGQTVAPTPARPQDDAAAAQGARPQTEAARPTPAAPTAPGTPSGPIVLASEPSQASWTKVCGPSDGANVCYTTRDFVSPQGQPVLAMAMYEVKGPQTSRIVRFLLPLGLLTKPGIRFAIDRAGSTAAAYTICFPNGCFAEAAGLSADWLAGLKRGTTLSIVVQNQTGKEVTFQVPLAGFAQAFDGPPIDPVVLKAQQERLQAELEKRSAASR